MRHLTATILLVLALLAPALCRAGANEELQNIKKQIKEKNRLITKTIHQKRVSFEFTGGIIILSNLPLGEIASLRAWATRKQSSVKA